MASRKSNTRKRKSSRKDGTKGGRPRPEHTFLLGIEGKECPRCKRWRALHTFGKYVTTWDGYSYACRECINSYTRGWISNSPEQQERQQAKHRKYYAENKDDILQYGHERYVNNRESILQSQKTEDARAKGRARKRREVQRNPEKFRQRSKRGLVLYADSYRAYRQRPEYKVHHNVSRAIRSALGKAKNGRRWEVLVGYTLSDLRCHLEARFSEGMTWDNYGEWEIDHIRPRSSFSFVSAEDEDFKKCWALDNLQPLWRSDNRRKWAHYAHNGLAS